MNATQIRAAREFYSELFMAELDEDVVRIGRASRTAQQLETAEESGLLSLGERDALIHGLTGG